MERSLPDALAAAPIVTDGGLSTQLEARGHDLATTLWSAQLLSDDPGVISAAHRDFFDVGAQVAISATYQASFEGFEDLGLDEARAAQLMRDGVGIAVSARDRAVDDASDGVPRWVATSIGPYGASLADGSEYRGDYGVSVPWLRHWHRRRLDVLAHAGGDVLAIETIPCAAEVEALLTEIDGTGIPAWLSLTCIVNADGRVTTRAGEDAAEVFAMAADVDEVFAVGVNCCDAGASAHMVSVATTAAGKPGIVYPNLGEGWDTSAKTWMGPGTFHPEQVDDWIDAGARLVGGCCRIGPDHIAAINARVKARETAA